MDSKKINVLVLGGTEFMGRSLVQRLAEDANCNLFIINRRKEHWDNLANKLPSVIYYYGDRDYPVEFTKLLGYISKKHGFTKESGVKWDLVVDFCAYERKETKSVIRGLGGLTKLYVFISSDSVYDVCDQKKRVLDDAGKILEASSVRPEDSKKIRHLSREEDYGHGKLMCEEYLASHQESLENPFAYVCLRLPDVIGPFDSTHRVWAYIKWIMVHNIFPVHMDTDSESKKLSLVYSEDIAGQIYSFAQKLQSTSDLQVSDFVNSLNGKSMNVSFDENLTLKELLAVVGKNFGIENITWITEKELGQHGKYFLPSVDCGPINNGLCKQLTGFQPTPIADALKKTLDFYDDIARNFKYGKEHKKANQKYEKVVQYYTKLREKQQQPAQENHAFSTPQPTAQPPVEVEAQISEKAMPIDPNLPDPNQPQFRVENEADRVYPDTNTDFTKIINELDMDDYL